MDPFIGYDEDSMDSETSSMASFRTDRTPATPDDDLDEVSLFFSLVLYDIVTKSSLYGEGKAQNVLVTVTNLEITLHFGNSGKCHLYHRISLETSQTCRVAL